MCRHLEIAESTWNRWLAQYGGMKANDAKRLKELETENARPGAAQGPEGDGRGDGAGATGPARWAGRGAEEGAPGPEARGRATGARGPAAGAARAAHSQPAEGTRGAPTGGAGA